MDISTITIVLILIISWLVYANVSAVIYSKDLKEFLEEVGEPAEYNQIYDYVDKDIYFDKNVVAGSTCASDKGVYFWSTMKFSVLVPWSAVVAIRLVELKGDLVANFRISSGSAIDRRLSASWKMEFNKYIPSTVSLVKG